MPLGALALLPAVFQLGQGIFQNAEANNLKESKYIPPELRMNRELAKTQRLSRRAPGTARAEENVRRNLSTSLSASRRAFGGDAGKMAAISSAASSQANDANARIAEMGERFSEDAMGREVQANREIAGAKERNRRQYEQTKAELYRTSGQNIFNSLSNVATFGIAGGFQGIDPEIKAKANESIAKGKVLNKQQAGRGAGGGDPYIKEGRQMKKAARRAKWNTVGTNMMAAQNPMLGMNAGYNNEYQEFLAYKAAQGR